MNNIIFYVNKFFTVMYVTKNFLKLCNINILHRDGLFHKIVYSYAYKSRHHGEQFTCPMKLTILSSKVLRYIYCVYIFKIYKMYDCWLLLGIPILYLSYTNDKLVIALSSKNMDIFFSLFIFSLYFTRLKARKIFWKYKQLKKYLPYFSCIVR